MTEHSIELSNITKKYKLYRKPADRVKEALFGVKKSKEFFAIQDISLNVRKGETLGIIGKNGSGKSTLLKIISGVLTESSGKKLIHGEVGALLELGTGFNLEYTGHENIFLNGTMRGFTKEQMNGKLQQIIDFADIGDFIHQPVKTYSSGMFSRLAFAVMISFKPEILIVDEALSVGDVFFQQKCNRYMKEEMTGITKILVSHDMSSIANMADQVIVLSGGRIVFYGDPLKGIEYYTKSLHSETFGTGRSDSHVSEIAVGTIDDRIDWTDVSEESLGGARDILIKSINIKVDGEAYKGFVSKGSVVELGMLVTSEIDSDEIIFGYLVNDKYGNAIFGENTFSSKRSVPTLRKGKAYKVKLFVTWPEVQENDYFITLGVGVGYHEMQHTIQCWAHNVFQIKNITMESVHAIFNNKIDSIEIQEL